MKTFKDSLRDELHNQNISVNELANMTGIKEQKLTYYIKNISYNSLSLHEILISGYIPLLIINMLDDRLYLPSISCLRLTFAQNDLSHFAFSCSLPASSPT